MTPLGEAALKLGARGLRVFPCWPRTKKPRFKDNLRLAAVDETIIRRWWSDAREDSNIGIATGRASGVWVLDVDADEGGEATLRELEAKHRALPPTVEAITADGRHLYWRWPEGVEIRNWQVREELPGLDGRGEGGFVLAPPSIHPDGPTYTWSVDSANHFADAPDWLLRLAVQRSKPLSNGLAAAPTLPASWQALMTAGHEGSRRAGAVAKLFGHLVRKYIDPAVALELVKLFDQARNKEPLGANEVIRICRDIAALEIHRRGGDE